MKEEDIRRVCARYNEWLRDHGWELIESTELRDVIVLGPARRPIPKGVIDDFVTDALEWCVERKCKED